MYNPIGVIGMRFRNIMVCEENRQSTWETTPEGLDILFGILRSNFLDKGVDGEIVGIYSKEEKVLRYAIFVEDGFLTA